MHTLATLPVALLAAAALAALAGASFADDYDCRSLTGEFEGDPPVAVSFSLADGAVAKAQFQIEDDIGYSTEATDPTSLATITGTQIGGEIIEFSFHFSGEGYDGDVAKLHVVTLSEGAHWITAGAFHAVGGGLYAIRCENPK